MRKDTPPPQEPAGDLEATEMPISSTAHSQHEVRKETERPTELVLMMRKRMKKVQMKEEASKARKKVSQKRKEELRRI